MTIADTFDALAVARDLESSGVEKGQAEAIASALRGGRAGLATKVDLDNLKTHLEGRMEAMESRLQATLYRALWIQGGAIVAIMAAIRIFG